MEKKQNSLINIFISHRSEDKLLANKLSFDLENLGYVVWIDAWKINAGDSIIEKINDGLSNTNYFLLCYSNKGIYSPWMSREWMSALSQQLNGKKIKILPILLSGGEPPAILADIKYVDLTANWENGISELMQVLK